jgi:hypothetical protein
MFVLSFDIQQLEKLKSITGSSCGYRWRTNKSLIRFGYIYFSTMLRPSADSPCFEGSSDLWSATSSCQTPDGQSCNGNNTANHGYTPSNTFQPNNLSFMVEYGSHNDPPTFVSGWVVFLRFLACFMDCLPNRHHWNRYCHIWRFKSVKASFWVGEYVFAYCNMLPLAYSCLSSGSQHLCR